MVEDDCEGLCYFGAADIHRIPIFQHDRLLLRQEGDFEFHIVIRKISKAIKQYMDYGD